MVWPLADLQGRIRDAVTSDDATSLAQLIVGGADPTRRLAIHARHYTASLVGALMRRFPATGWLLGTPLVEEAARQFVREHSPSAPCIAEYGHGFAQFLTTRTDTGRVPYVREFADLEWHLGRLAVSVDRSAITLADCTAVAPTELANAVVAIQPGTHYVHTSWPIDELMTLYLTDTAPDRLTMVETEVWIEARGARGSFRFSRLTAAEFSFRVALSKGFHSGQPRGVRGEATWCSTRALRWWRWSTRGWRPRLPGLLPESGYERTARSRR